MIFDSDREDITYLALSRLALISMPSLRVFISYAHGLLFVTLSSNNTAEHASFQSERGSHEISCHHTDSYGEVMSSDRLYA